MYFPHLPESNQNYASKVISNERRLVFDHLFAKYIRNSQSNKLRFCTFYNSSKWHPFIRRAEDWYLMISTEFKKQTSLQIGHECATLVSFSGYYNCKYYLFYLVQIFLDESSQRQSQRALNQKENDNRNDSWVLRHAQKV